MKRIRPLPQVETAECALACLAMLAEASGSAVSMRELRKRFALSQRGTSLKRLSAMAEDLGFANRAVRLDLDGLHLLKMPCILHWDLKHFVILEAVSRRWVTIVDPAVGRIRLAHAEVSRRFSGVAIELTPTNSMVRKADSHRPTAFDVVGKVSGLVPSAAKIGLAALCLELFAISAPLYSQLVIDGAVSGSDLALLTILALGFGAALVIQTVIRIGRSMIVIAVSEKLSVELAARLFSHLMRLPVDWFERRQQGDIATRFAAFSAIQRLISTSTVETVIDGLLAMTAFALMIVYSPELSAISVAAAGIYAILRIGVSHLTSDVTATRLAASARERSYFVESLRAISTIKVASAEGKRSTAWWSLNAAVERSNSDLGRLQALQSAGGAFIFGVETLLVLFLIASAMVEGPASGEAASFTVGMLFAYMTYKNIFCKRALNIIDFVADLRVLRLHIDQLADISLEPEAPRGGFEVTKSDVQQGVGVDIVDVWYRYGDDLRWTLQGIDLTIAPGRVTALVGASGSGKSTLVRIVAGLVRPNRGNIRLLCHDGIGGGDSPAAVIATVLQEDVLLSGTVRDNITFFDDAPDESFMEQCAIAADIHDDIFAMAMGYSSVIGDLGTGMSGGQRQRIMLARALYRRPDVLVLDEATSHLDPESEQRVLSSIRRLGITTLLVAHRAETVRFADRVVRLQP
jgi:ATP-binding cassette subfamily B protein RaxB